MWLCAANHGGGVMATLVFLDQEFHAEDHPDPYAAERLGIDIKAWARKIRTRLGVATVDDDRERLIDVRED